MVRSTRDAGGQSAVERFAGAWQRGNYRAMYTLVDARQRASLSPEAFAAAYRSAMLTATATGLVTGRAKRRGESWTLPVTVRTRLFGPIRGTVSLRLSSGEPRSVLWSRSLTFPGLTGGARLRRHVVAPRRARLLARDGRLLADPDGVPTDLGARTGTSGEVGRAEGPERRRLIAAGFPADTAVGVSGLQKALDTQLRGRPGGTLLAGTRVLARARAVPAPPVRASIDPRVAAAAQEALGGRFGGVAVLEPATGEVLALAGIAADGAQPPGSTFKIMTVTAALEAGLVNLRSRFPVQTGADVGGRFLANAHDEACGGDLTESF